MRVAIIVSRRALSILFFFVWQKKKEEKKTKRNGSNGIGRSAPLIPFASTQNSVKTGYGVGKNPVKLGKIR